MKTPRPPIPLRIISSRPAGFVGKDRFPVSPVVDFATNAAAADLFDFGSQDGRAIFSPEWLKKRLDPKKQSRKAAIK
jgi:hypothetical protein